MKKQNLAILFIAVLFASCAKVDSGQLTGVLDRPSWNPINPYGMQYIPSGTLHIGPSDQDVNHALVQRPKQISIQGFFMDDTEITNNEYRQFVNWVEIPSHTFKWDTPLNMKMVFKVSIGSKNLAGHQVVSLMVCSIKEMSSLDPKEI